MDSTSTYRGPTSTSPWHFRPRSRPSTSSPCAGGTRRGRQNSRNGPKVNPWGSRKLTAFAQRNRSLMCRQGKWWVENDQLCQKWTSWMDGQSYCYKLTLDGSKVTWVRNDGHSGTARIGG